MHQSPSDFSFQRVQRTFSNDFKRKKVRELERRTATVAEICHEYEVSRTAVYKWIYKFSAMGKKKIKTIVEAKSDTRKIEQLKEQIKQLEQALGQKQMVIEFQQKVIDFAEDHYRVDIKKKNLVLHPAMVLGTPPRANMQPKQVL